MNDFASKLELLPVILPALILSLVLHELGHAYVAHWLGDKTPQQQGRLTLNPIKHLDTWGSAMFLFTFMFTSFSFGWARPVIVNAKNLGHPQRHMALVAIAGPLVNFTIAVGTMAAIIHGFDLVELGIYTQRVIAEVVVINIVLGVFNLFPIPPLDGSRIVGAFMPKRMYEDWSKLDEYAPFFLLALLIFFQGPVFEIIGDATLRIGDLLTNILGGHEDLFRYLLFVRSFA